MAEVKKPAKMTFLAIEFAARAHSGQFRKGTDLPYLLHPLGVAKILIEAGADEEIVVAGLLHDTTEDAGASLPEIRQTFGDRVADLVQAASEPDKSASWENRKRHTLEQVKSLPLSALLVEAADKLDNIRAIREDHEKLGDAMFSRFNRGKDSQRWYYQGLAKAFLDRTAEGAGEIFRQFKAEVEKVFGKLEA